MIFARSLVVTLGLLVWLMIPRAAFGDSSVDFSNSGGSLSSSSTGLSLSGSTLIAITGFNGNGIVTGDLGSVSFATGALSSGSLQMGGTFAAGGSFTVDGNRTNGVPSGSLFSGSFSGPVICALTTLGNGTHSYTLTGIVTGAAGGASVEGVTVQLTTNTGKGFFDGSAATAGDTTLVGSVPEPSSDTLLGTGIFALGATIRRKLRV